MREEERYKKILSASPEPPARLAERILRSIDREDQRRLRQRIFASSALFAGSLVVTATSLMSFDHDLARSGFLSFLSLFGTDFSFVAANLRDVAFSLAESFPAFSAAFSLAGAGFVAWFASRLFRETAALRKGRFTETSLS